MSATSVVSPPFLKAPPFRIDASWHNFAFASRMAVAAIASLALTYWLELQDPQWSIVTVYVLAQPITGAALAKGAYRVVGTVIGGIVGLFIIKLYSQAPAPLVGFVALWLGLCFYVGAQMRNFTAYGFLIAGYTTALIGLEGAFNPTGAWQIAFDRIAEIVIGIVCVTAVSVLFFPRYAGVVLRERLAELFCRLCRYGAVALRPATPFATFAALRREMIAGVVTFDALRSYTMFEAPNLRADDAALRAVVQEFLGVLAVARGLYMRIEDFQVDEAGIVADRIRPVMEKTAATLDDIAGGPDAFADSHSVSSRLRDARAGIDTATVELEAMAGHVPFEPLADGRLILGRTKDLLHSLSMVMESKTVGLAANRRNPTPIRPTTVASASIRLEALLQAIRSALVLILICAFWMATEWTDGFSAFIGAVIILFVAVNQDRPEKLGFAFLLWSAVGMFAAYIGMVFVLPHIEGFWMLALFLFVALLPAGLMAGSAQFATQGIAFGVFLTSEIGTGNVFQPNELIFFNSVFSILVGMAICLVLINLFPVNSLKTRGRTRVIVLGRLLPEAARGERPGREILAEIISMLADLLPRLSLAHPSEENFLRGMLGAASTGLELGQLNRVERDPALPQDAMSIIAAFLRKFADEFNASTQTGLSPATHLAKAESLTKAASAALASLPLAPGSPAAALTVRAGASLRFIADRFDIDRPLLDLPFDET